MDDTSLLMIIYLLLAPLGILIAAVFWIWVISEGVAKGMMKYDKVKNKKEK